MKYIVEKVPLWSVTAWDKSFNGVEKSWQSKTVKYKYLLSDELDQINVGGDVRLLYTGKDIGYTTEALAGDALCEGEIVSIPWGGTPSVKYYKGKFVTGDNRIATSLDPENLLNKYLYYYMQGHLDEISSYYRGAGLKHPSMKDVLKMRISYPSIETQQRIIHQFEYIENLIALRHQELQKLDELIKARFVELFGMPGTDVKGWGLQPLGECCELNPKKGNDKRLVPGLEVSFVPMPAVSENGAIDASEVKAYDEVKTGFTYFAENDVLFAKITPCMENGKGAVAVGLCNEIGFGSTEFHVLRPIVEKSNPYWLYSLTSFEVFRKDAAANMTGSAGQRRVPATFLDKYKVALPPIELQNQFAVFVKQVDKSKLLQRTTSNSTSFVTASPCHLPQRGRLSSQRLPLWGSCQR